METRKLGQTDMDVTVLSYGASSLGQEFRSVDLNEALRSVYVAIERGIEVGFHAEDLAEQVVLVLGPHQVEPLDGRLHAVFVRSEVAHGLIELEHLDQRVEVHVDGIGTLRNGVRDE